MFSLALDDQPVVLIRGAQRSLHLVLHSVIFERILIEVLEWIRILSTFGDCLFVLSLYQHGLLLDLSDLVLQEVHEALELIFD